MITRQNLSRRRLHGMSKMLDGAMPAPKDPLGWEVEIAEVKARLKGFESELQAQGRQQAEGFERIDRTLTALFAKVDSATNRPAPWGIIVTAAVGVCGLGLTVSTALALWANAYFGSAIRGAEARAVEAHQRLDRQSERLDARMQAMQEFQWENRSLLLRSSQAPASFKDAGRSIE